MSKTLVIITGERVLIPEGAKEEQCFLKLKRTAMCGTECSIKGALCRFPVEASQ